MSNEDIDLTAVYLLGYEKGKAAALKQLKPLTDEEICDLWAWSLTAEAERTNTTQQQHAFARAIEKKIRGEE